MSRADALATMPMAQSDRKPARSTWVLIEVPDASEFRTNRPHRTTEAGLPFARRKGRGRKRRLRREVRAAAFIVLTLSGLAGLGALGWSSRTGQVLASADFGGGEGIGPGVGRDGRGGAHTAADEPVSRRIGSSRVVVLSIESPSSAPGAEGEVPVILPGYVLPDDSFEESAHEGS